jgi:hypothetical protein
MIDIPTLDFLPDIDNYSYAMQGYLNDTSTLFAPVPLQRPIRVNNADILTASWSLEIYDYWTFSNFYRDRIYNAAPFIISLPTQSQVPKPVVAWFIEDTFQLNGVTAELYTFSCNLEILRNGYPIAN